MDSHVITAGVNSISNSYIRSAKRDQRSSADLNVPPGEKLYRMLRGELERADRTAIRPLIRDCGPY